jgi:hypothetical protein
MGKWKYLHLLVLLLAAYYLVFSTYQYRAITADSSPEVVKTVGPWQVAFTHPREVAPGTTASVGVRFVCQGCQANYKQLAFAIESGGSPVGPPILVTKPATQFVTPVPIPKALTTDPQIWLTIEGWDGIEYRTSWPLTMNR